VPLNDASRQAMADYLAAMQALTSAKKKSVASSKWLFPSFGESGHLTRQHFARDLKELASAAGLAPRLVSPACAASRLCEPSPAQRRGSSHRADPARPHRHLDHADLHPRSGRAAEEPGARPAPAGGEAIAFSSEVDTGSRDENASKSESIADAPDNARRRQSLPRATETRLPPSPPDRRPSEGRPCSPRSAFSK